MILQKGNLFEKQFSLRKKYDSEKVENSLDFSLLCEKLKPQSCGVLKVLLDGCVVEIPALTRAFTREKRFRDYVEEYHAENCTPLERKSCLKILKELIGQDYGRRNCLD